MCFKLDSSTSPRSKAYTRFVSHTYPLTVIRGVICHLTVPTVSHDLDALSVVRRTANRDPLEENDMRFNVSNPRDDGHAYIPPVELFPSDGSSPEASETMAASESTSDEQPRRQCFSLPVDHKYSARTPTSDASWTNVSSHTPSTADDRVLETRNDSHQAAEGKGHREDSHQV
jgi:hypothetical protein